MYECYSSILKLKMNDCSCEGLYTIHCVIVS